jgi:hypothetical protein
MSNPRPRRDPILLRKLECPLLHERDVPASCLVCSQLEVKRLCTLTACVSLRFSSRDVGRLTAGTQQLAHALAEHPPY